MVKKLVLLCSALTWLAAGNVSAQTPHCFADEMNARAAAANPAAVAAAEAQLKAEIDAALGKMNFPKLKVTAGDDDTVWKDKRVLMIPIVFHVVHNYGVEYVTDDNIYEELKNINRLYRGANPDTNSVIRTYAGNIPGTSIKYIPNTNIQFYLPTKDPMGNPTKGITRYRNFVTNSGGDHAKFDVWPRENYLNVWIINSFDGSHAGAAAYAYQPPAANGMPWVDGPITFMQAPLNYDNTLAHEIGHSLSLAHPWGNTNAPEVACGDDGVDDTPPTYGHNTVGCVPAALYDTRCNLTSLVMGKQRLNTAWKSSDNLTGQGIRFKTFTKVNLDQVSIYPRDSGKPFTIVLKHKTAPNTYTTTYTYSGVTTDNKVARTLGLPANQYTASMATSDTLMGQGIQFRLFDSLAIRNVTIYTDTNARKFSKPYQIVLKKNGTVINSASGIVTDSAQLVNLNFGIPYTDSNSIYSLEFAKNPGVLRTVNSSVGGSFGMVDTVVKITADTSVGGLYNYFYRWNIYVFNYAQKVPLAFVAPLDTTVDAYSLEFSTNPGMYKDWGKARGLDTGIANVVNITNDLTAGYYNYFYGWNTRYGDYFVSYSPSVVKNLFNVSSAGPVIIDYPDTVNSQNVMDYTYCSKMFTYLQGARMRAALRSNIAGRSTLIDSFSLKQTGVLVANGTMAPAIDIAPIADFSNVQSFTCVNATTPINFINRSWRDTLSKLTWTFSNGAQSPTSVVANPVMNSTAISNKFSTPGWVTIQVLAESNAGKDTLVDSSRLYVADGVAVSPDSYFQEFDGNDLSRYPMFNYFNNFTKWEVVNNAGFYDNTSIRYKQFDTRPIGTILGTPRGDWDDFYTPAFDLNGLSSGNLFLTFFSAGAFRTNNTLYMTDTLEIGYTVNCGITWTTLKKMSATDIGNNGIQLNDWTPGGMWDWTPQNITISPTAIGAGTRDKVYFRFRYRPGANQYLIGSGNNFYLDRIHIGKWTLDANDLAGKEAGFTLAPNPTSGSTTVMIKDAKSTSAHISVTDVTGKLVYSADLTLNANITRFEIPANAIAVRGMYMVSVTTGTQKQTQKLMVQ
ncbi:MAG: zinc-dependent metalloprotease [Bacteroidetes bacterium]|nr:zinc-dependent metalloprotease [Bacteroidota bacterium]